MEKGTKSPKVLRHAGRLRAVLRTGFYILFKKLFFLIKLYFIIFDDLLFISQKCLSQVKSGYHTLENGHKLEWEYEITEKT